MLKRLLLLFTGTVLSTTVAATTPNFQMIDLDGKSHNLSDYRGKWVVVNYWATWCSPCLEEIPELEIFHSNHKDKDAVVLGVNMENIARKVLRRFVDEQFISYPVSQTKPARDSAFGKVLAMPTSYLVNPEGEVVARQEGRITARELESFIDKQRN